MRRNYPSCDKCGHLMNPVIEDDCDKLYLLQTGELYCEPCFKEYLKNMVDDDPDELAGELGIPVLYVER